MPPPPPRSRAETALEACALACAAAAASTFLIAAAIRLRYPFEIEWLESEMLQHVVRVMAGRTLYAPPSAEFSPTIYPPLFAWLSAAVASVVGAGFHAPRIISVCSTLATALLAAATATRLTADRRAGWIAAALLLASYVPCGTVLDLARLDPLWVFLLLTGCCAAARAETPRAAAVAGLLLVAATATKQPAGLFAIVLGTALWRQRRRAGLALLGVWLGGCAAFYLALHVATGGWSTTYVLWIPLAVKHLPGSLVHFLRDDLLHGYAPSAAILIVWALRDRFLGLPPAARPRSAGSLPGSYWLAFAVAAFASLSMRTLQGGGANTLLPLVAFGAMMTGAVAGRVLATADATARSTLWVLLALQFGSLLYNPWAAAPGADDRRRSAALVERIRAFSGEVWIPSHTAYAFQAGKPFLVHRDPLLDLLYSGHDAFPEDLLLRLRRGDFAALVLDGPFVEPRLQDAVDEGYALADEIQDPPRPLTGYRTAPRLLYLPRAARQP